MLADKCHHVIRTSYPGQARVENKFRHSRSGLDFGFNYVRDWGIKVTSRVNKTLRRILRACQPSLKRRSMTVHTDSHVVA